MRDFCVNLVTEHDEDLESNDEENNSNEHSVGVDSFQEVPFIINLSSAKHVEDLHPDKHVEND